MSLLIEVLAAALGTISFSVLFQVAPRHYLSCGLTGALGWLVYRLLQGAGSSDILATFVATVTLTVAARWFSTLWRTPTLIFLVCGIFTLVPGAAIYYTAYYLFLNDSAAAAAYGATTLKLAVAIALGILTAYSLPARLFGWRHNV